MKALSLECVPEWVNVQNVWVPRSIDTNCPFCGRQVCLALKESVWDHRRKTMSTSAQCPGCGNNVFCWVIEPGPTSDPTRKNCSCLAIFPGNQDNHEEIEGSEYIPGPLRKSYGEVIQVYNQKVWSATLTLCRRTLEGVVLHLTNSTSSNETLDKMLRSLPDKVDLGKPITSLADSVRLGGNIGAHFDNDLDPNEEMARTMLNILEYLLEYVFTIPKLIEDAKRVVDKPKSTEE